jgi:hypothetical protein
VRTISAKPITIITIDITLVAERWMRPGSGTCARVA